MNKRDVSDISLLLHTTIARRPLLCIANILPHILIAKCTITFVVMLYCLHNVKLQLLAFAVHYHFFNGFHKGRNKLVFVEPRVVLSVYVEKKLLYARKQHEYC